MFYKQYYPQRNSFFSDVGEPRLRSTVPNIISPYFFSNNNRQRHQKNDFERFHTQQLFNNVFVGTIPRFIDNTNNLGNIPQQRRWRHVLNENTKFHAHNRNHGHPRTARGIHDVSTAYFMTDPIITGNDRITIQLAQVRLGPTGDQQRVFIEQDFSNESELNRFVRDLKKNFDKTLKTRYEKNGTVFEQEHGSTTNFKKSGVVVVEEPGEEPKTYPRQQQTRTEKTKTRNESQSSMSQEKSPHRTRSYSGEHQQYSKSYTDIKTNNRKQYRSKSCETQEKNDHYEQHHNKNFKRRGRRDSLTSASSTQMRRRHRSLSKSKILKKDKKTDKSSTLNQNRFYSMRNLVKNQDTSSPPYSPFTNNYSKYRNRTRNELNPSRLARNGFFSTAYTPFSWEKKHESNFYNKNKRNTMEHSQMGYYSHNQQPFYLQPKRFISENGNFRRMQTPTFVSPFQEKNIQYRFRAPGNVTLNDTLDMNQVSRPVTTTNFRHVQPLNTSIHRPPTQLSTQSHITPDNNLIQQHVFGVTSAINQNGQFSASTQQIFNQSSPKTNVMNNIKPPPARPPTNLGLPVGKQYQQKHEWTNRAPSRLLQQGRTTVEQSFIHPHLTEQRVCKAHSETDKLFGHQPHRTHNLLTSSLLRNRENIDYSGYATNLHLQPPHRRSSFRDLKMANGFNSYMRQDPRSVKYFQNMMRQSQQTQTFMCNPH